MTSKEALKKAWDLVHDKYPENNEEIQLVRHAIKTAMELEERNTPMQVQIKYSVHKYTYILERQQCPNCSKPIIYSQPNYCGHCGQRLNWRKQK